MKEKETSMRDLEYENVKSDKIARILGIYTKLMNGGIVNKAEEARQYGVNERSIQRDIDDIREYFENETADIGFINSVIYDRSAKGYRLEQLYKTRLSNSEILAVCKILLDSRAFTKKEMLLLLDKLVECCVPQTNQKAVMDLISNEEFHYVEPRHHTVFIDKLWTLGQAIRASQYIEIDYMRTKDKKIVRRKLKPVAILFSEYYFYLTAFIDDKEVQENFDVLNDAFPTIYRLDRIKKLKLLDEKFHIPYSARFEEGEFPQAHPVHVRRQAAESKVRVQRNRCRCRTGSPANCEDHKGRRWKVCDRGGGVWKGD